MYNKLQNLSIESSIDDGARVGVQSSIDLLSIFLQKSNPTMMMETPEEKFRAITASLKLADEKVVLQDEMKFQEYFLKEKDAIAGRSPISKDSELNLNRELVEQCQERIIEEEETVTAFSSYPDEKLSKVEKVRRSNVELKVSQKPAFSLFSSLKTNIGGLFKAGNIPVGLKGGADNKKAGPSTLGSPSTSSSKKISVIGQLGAPASKKQRSSSSSLGTL